jgi:hypothetical protein
MVGPGFLYTKTQRNSINWKSVAAGARPWCRRTVPDCGLLPVAQKRPLAGAAAATHTVACFMAVDRQARAPSAVTWSDRRRAPGWGLGSNRLSAKANLDDSRAFRFPVLTTLAMHRSSISGKGWKFHQNSHVLMNSTNP